MKFYPGSSICGAAVLLIFLSIVPNGSSEVWFEAFSLVLSLSLCLFLVAKGEWRSIPVESLRLLMPLLALSVYSLIQGLVTLLIEDRVIGTSVFLPYSFDLTASVWNSVKLLGLGGFVVVWLFSLRRHFRSAVIGLAAIGNLFAAAGIARFAVQGLYPSIRCCFPGPQLEAGTGFGPFANQNHFALLMLMVFGLNIGLFHLGQLKPRRRLLLLITSVMSWTALVLTASRGGIIASFAVVAVLVVLSTFRCRSHFSDPGETGALALAKKFLVIGFVSAILVFGVILVGRDRVVHRFNKIPLELSESVNAPTFRRIDVWDAAIEIVRRNPGFGIGFGGFRYGVSRFLDTSGNIVPQQAHNDYLEFAASGGSVAALIGAWLLWAFARAGRERFREPADRFTHAARVGALCGICGAAIHSFFDFGLQYLGNMLFFAALAGIVVHRELVSVERPSLSLILERRPALRAAFTVVLIAAIGVCGLFGYARLSLAHTVAGTSAPVENPYYVFSFDAEIHDARAEFHLRKNDLKSALGELENALRYRPRDYALWLKIAGIAERLGRNDHAEASFRRAIELAPLFAEPHYRYGQFLTGTGRKREGLGELVFSVHRDVRYLENVLPIVWEQTGADPEATAGHFLTASDTAKFRTTKFLFEKREYRAVVNFICEIDLPLYDRDMMVRMLLEKGQFRFAWKISQDRCNADGEHDANFLNGDFENDDLGEGTHFGWTIGDSVGRETVRFDPSTRSSGNRSLRFKLSGDYETPLLWQTVVVEPGQRYKLSFSYRTGEIKTGGVPVVQVILKGPDLLERVKELRLPTEGSDWTEAEVAFETNSRTEAVEVRLTRQPCGQRVCPIYGTIWIDDFRLARSSE